MWPVGGTGEWHVACWRDRRVPYHCYGRGGGREGREQFEDIGVEERIMIKLLFNTWDRVTCTGFIWLRIGTGGGHFQLRKLTSGIPKISRNYCTSWGPVSSSVITATRSNNSLLNLLSFIGVTFQMHDSDSYCQSAV